MTVSRMQLAHPAENATGGAALHAAVDLLYKTLGDAMPARWFTQVASIDGAGLANAATVDFVHNFLCAFSDLRCHLFLVDNTTLELTRISGGSTPDLSGFTIAATPGSTTTSVRVTNSSGSTRNLALVVLQDPVQLPYNKVIGTGGYATLTAAFAGAAAGDRFIVTDDTTDTAAVTLSVADVEVTWAPGKTSTVNAATAASNVLSVTGARSKLFGAKLKYTGANSPASLLHVNAADVMVGDGSRVEMNSNVAISTAAVSLGASAVRAQVVAGYLATLVSGSPLVLADAGTNNFTVVMG